MEGLVTTAQAEDALERIVRRYNAKEIVSEVLPNEKDQTLFIEGLCELSEVEGSQILLGGRRIREAIGFTVIDYAKYVASDAHLINTDPYAHNRIRLGPLLDIQARYDKDRLEKPDLDFFVKNLHPQLIIDTFQSKGFDVTMQTASGRAQVVEIRSKNGLITFINHYDSWQTTENWPMLGFKAKFENGHTPVFHLDIAKGRVYLYPLEIPGVNSMALDDPLRLTTLGRVLLWLLTVKDPNGNWLTAPGVYTQKAFVESIEILPDLLNRIEENPELEIQYRSALRDLALGLRIVLLNDWHERLDYTSEIKDFLKRLDAAWTGAKKRTPYRIGIRMEKANSSYDKYTEITFDRILEMIY